MYTPENITRLSRFAFPEYDDTSPDAQQELAAIRQKLLTSRGRTFGAHLMKHDVYHVDFVVHHHTFSLLLSDGKTRVHGHVRRYLPPHVDSVSRMDVGRRRPRAMILLTRAMGGERFFSSVLKTVEAVTVESQVNKKGCFAKKKDPVRSFLHALFNRHATLITQYAELRRHGLSLNFTQAPNNGMILSEGKSACETAKTIMEENEDLFRIKLDKIEFGTVGVGNKKGSSNGGGTNLYIEKDIVQFYLPPTLQPGFECLPLESIPEDIASPIIPLLRYIGPSHFVRLLSALLMERRVILISKSITRLSMCVRAASSILAQGLLLWKHILIPIVPPHMLRFLSVKAPYLVGILYPSASMLGKIEGLTDVLCVNVDKNELKTLNMTNPRSTVPDMLKRMGKTSKKSDSGPNSAECLAKDLDEIMKADQLLWLQEAGGYEKMKENGVKALDSSEHELLNNSDHSMAYTKESIIGKMKKKLKLNKKLLDESRDIGNPTDAAVAFGKMIRSTFQKDGEDDLDHSAAMDDEDNAEVAPKYAAPSHDIDIGSVEASIVAENEGGEEDIRAALTCFFIHMYGDMGMYLSETHGTFWLDRRKFLLRKKQLGEKENSPVFVVLQKFSTSSMFAIHVKGRIDDMSMTARDRSNIMPHHIPLFDICSKYLSVHRLDFSLMNVRRIVAKTVLACTRHIVVERHIAMRTRALALTEDAPFDGNVASAISELVDSCHECNTNLSVVMSVIWHRLNQTKKNMPILLALHLLKNLVSHGPMTAVTEALDGAGKIYELKTYSDAKSAEHNREVRQAADHVYELLVDLSSLYSRRRRIAYLKAEQLNAISQSTNSWSDYLVRRLPLAGDAHKMHALFRPDGMTGKVFYDAGASVAPSVAASNATPSVMALSRLSENLMETREEPRSTKYDQNEEDRLFGSAATGSYLNDSSAEDRYLRPTETGPDDEPRTDIKTLDDSEDDRAGSVEQNPEHGISPEDFLNESAYTYDNSESMLASFNYAVSSHSGSHFGSERSSSPPLPGAKKSNFRMGSINEGRRRFTLGDVPDENSTAQGSEENDEDLETSYRSNCLQVSESDRFQGSQTDRHPFLN